MERDDKWSLTISWHEMKDIKLKKYSETDTRWSVFIISKRIYEGKNLYIELYMNSNVAPKYLKSIKTHGNVKRCQTDR